MTTIAAIARACGVGKATASRALSGHPAVAEPTRQRVRQMAQRLGYEPDPQLARLARRRWPQGRRADPAPLALLLQGSLERTLLAQGWLQTARELGYRLVHLDPRQDDVVARIDALGVRGVLLMLVEDDVALRLPWHRLAVLALDGYRADLPVHRVCRDWVRHLDLAVTTLRERGYRRIGHVQLRHASASTNANMEEALATVLRRQRRQLGPQPLPFWYAPGEGPLAFSSWLARQRPDALVARFETQWHQVRDLGLSCPRDLGYLSLVPPWDPRSTPIDHIEAWTPAARRLALGQLHHLVTEAAWGLPAQPMHILLPGVLRAGGSLRPLPVTRPDAPTRARPGPNRGPAG